MVDDEFYSMCRGTSKDNLLLEKINNAFEDRPSSMSDVVRNLLHNTELSVESKDGGIIEVSSDNESYALYYRDGICWLIPKGNIPGGFIKVVFDNGIQIVDEPEPDYAEDYDTATDEEIEALIGIE